MTTLEYGLDSPRPLSGFPRAQQKPGRVEDVRTLYDDLLREGALAVHALRGRSEELDFDCKRKKTPTNGSFDAEDRQNLGKTLSAFANSMGGLLLWGVDARKDQSSGLDVVSGFDPITDVRRFESDARTLSSEALMPRIHNIDIAAIEEPPGSGNGYLAMYVARSERRLHHCEIKDVKGYYRRSMSSSRLMEHYEIEDAFRRQTVPFLDLETRFYHGSVPYVSKGQASIQFGISFLLVNNSHLSALYPYVSVEVPGAEYKQDNARVLPSVVTRFDNGMWCADGESGLAIHPGTSRTILNLYRTITAFGENQVLYFEYSSVRETILRAHYGCLNAAVQTKEIAVTGQSIVQAFPNGRAVVRHPGEWRCF